MAGGSGGEFPSTGMFLGGFHAATRVSAIRLAVDGEKDASMLGTGLDDPDDIRIDPRGWWIYPRMMFAHVISSA